MVTNGFVDSRLDQAVEQGAQGGPGFLTTILQLSSGFEKRNIEWSRSRGQWDISYGIQSPDDLQDVINLFYVCMGRGYGFRFTDWADYTIGDADTNTPQDFFTGDGSTLIYQIYKVYTVPSGDYFFRPITRPVSGTFSVWLNGVQQMSGWSINYDTGIITFVSAPPSGHQIGVIGQFDVPVRFDTDLLKVKTTWTEAVELPAINLIELKEAT